MNEIDNNLRIREKIQKGLSLSLKKLISYKKKNGGVLVFSEKGKIIKIEAINLVD
ncbi:hypothetical protein ABIB40_000133 [Pedobacter sp. UYP30]|uniref:hypothetical protein n=1 Tax=Pedobacter sp. UYP30 TaxID=1756400 RepID=UPI00339A0867